MTWQPDVRNAWLAFGVVGRVSSAGAPPRAEGRGSEGGLFQEASRKALVVGVVVVVVVAGIVVVVVSGCRGGDAAERGGGREQVGDI